MGEQSACGPRSLGRPPGGGSRARAPGHPCSRVGQGCGRARNTNEAPAAPAVPAAGEDPAPPLPGSPPHPGPARSGWAGSESSGFAAPAPRLAPQPRVRAPAGTPPRALPACAPPTRSPARPSALTGQGHRTAGTKRPSSSRAPRDPCGRGERAGASTRPVPAALSALAPRRLPVRARRLRSKAPAAMIAGSGTRAHARAQLWDPQRTDSP